MVSFAIQIIIASVIRMIDTKICVVCDKKIGLFQRYGITLMHKKCTKQLTIEELDIHIKELEGLL